jgi:hypothetical protein
MRKTAFPDQYSANILLISAMSRVRARRFAARYPGRFSP